MVLMTSQVDFLQVLLPTDGVTRVTEWTPNEVQLAGEFKIQG